MKRFSVLSLVILFSMPAYAQEKFSPLGNRTRPLQERPLLLPKKFACALLKNGCAHSPRKWPCSVEN